MKSADFDPQIPSEIVHRGEGMSVLVIYGFWHLESVPQTVRQYAASKGSVG